MSSDKKIAANRKNALRSTGPQTAEGKARSSSNSRRHGLASKSGLDSSDNLKIEQLSRGLSEGSNDYWVAEAARSAAERFVQLQRVRSVKGEIIRRLLDPSVDDTSNFLFRELAKFETYERKARSRWKKSMRDLDLVKAA
jgi:hypothetical protein